MQDTDLYSHILGLEEPWFVGNVELGVEEQQVDIRVEHGSGVRWPCPTCGRKLAIRDHAEERVWRHLDTCQFKTFLHARVPRIECPDHGVLQVRVPWAEPRSRFTLLMERMVIDVLHQCVTVKRAGLILRMSWDEVWGVMERAVHRGQDRKKDGTVTRYGVDEKAFRKGHSYMTVVSDLDRATVEHVSEERTTDSLKKYWQSLEQEQLDSIKSVSMDMWDPYIQATLSIVPDADQKIVFDRFHIVRHILKAVDTVRKQEHRALMAKGDDTLKRTKYLWLYNEENIPERHWPKLHLLRDLYLKIGRAHAIKESFRQFWEYRRAGWAKRFFDDWYWWATHSRLEPMRKVAHTIKDHLWGILNYFKHRVTNAVSEGLNSKIMAIKRLAGGYRNRKHFKISIYFHCGGLDLYPR